MDNFRVLMVSAGQAVRHGLVLECQDIHGISMNKPPQTVGRAEHCSPVLSLALHLLVCVCTHVNVGVGEFVPT